MNSPCPRAHEEGAATRMNIEDGMFRRERPMLPNIPSSEKMDLNTTVSTDRPY